MRRMKEMSRLQGGGGMNFYGQMPDQYNLVVNTEHPTVKRILDNAAKELTLSLAQTASDISTKNDQIKPLEEEKYKAKAGEFPTDKDNLLNELRKDVDNLKATERQQVADYAKGDKTLRQLIDLALLQGGMLKGEALAEFIRRSQEML
jgi:molecular chaperone HtpG